MGQLSPTNITRIKNITNEETGRAYLDLEDKEFVLHFPNWFKKRILDTTTDELLVLYQTIENKRYLTHLVRPIDNEVIEKGTRANFKFGRIFEVISYPGDKSKISFDLSSLSNLDFRNRGWGNAVKLTEIADSDQIGNIQLDLWNLFKPYFTNDLKENQKDYQNFFNDELNRDFESKEGKELFRQHRIRERDSSLTYEKKTAALKNANLKCEVCSFSFQDTFDQDYIECHHKIPIYKGERITRLEDLALVCSNCHRMLHRKINGDFLTIEQLRKHINQKKR
jgi:5-methylcytosine-specific restriction protein A